MRGSDRRRGLRGGEVTDRWGSIAHYQAAAVQMAPVWMDREATTQKVVRLIQEAGAKGAALIVFPEVIIPGTPHWIWREPEPYDYYAEPVKNAVL